MYHKLPLSVLIICGLALGARGQTAPPAKAPIKVGVPFVTKEQYKPVAGKVGGRLVRDTLGEPKTFNPVTAGETSTTEYTNRIFQGLTDSDAFTGEVKPLIAEKWEVADDGVTWTFHLRKDVTFNDGSPLTAKDVIFSWNELMYDASRPDKAAAARWPCSMRDIMSFDGKPVAVTAIDDYTVRMVAPAKIAIFPDLAGGVRILSEKAYRRFVTDGSFGSQLSANSKPEELVGSGPYMLEQYVRGEKVVLKRNPNFWMKDDAGGKLPYIDQEIFVISRDINSILLNFQQGISDSYSLRSGKDVAELKPKQDQGNFTLYQLGADYSTSFVCFNMNLEAAAKGTIPEYKVKWFRDPRFRKAISYGIDRGSLVRNVLRNLGYPQAAPFTTGVGPFVQQGFEPYPYDPAKAKALLAEMGFKPGKDGILEDADGHKLSFTINTNSGNNVREEMANFIRTDLSKLGMEVNTLYLEFNLLVEKMDSKFDWECLVMGFTGGLEPHFGANVWKSSGRLHMWWPNQKSPSFKWEARIDEIFTQGIQELDREKRKALYREWVQIVQDEQPMVYLVVSERVAAVRRKFGNLFPCNGPTPIWHNEEQIFVLDPK